MLIWAIAIYIVAIAALYFGQRLFIFQPVPLEKNFLFEFDHPFEEVWLATSDGQKINGLFFPTQKKRQGAMLYLHGNRGNLQRWGHFHADFTKRGYDVFMVDYRGYGKSNGRPSEGGLYLDAEAAYQWIIQRVQPEDLVIYGRSLGTGVASKLASRFQARLLILETPFNSITGTIKYKFPFFYFPINFNHHFPNDHYLPQIKIPVYAFHGTWDLIVPYRSARQLRPLMPTPEHFITIPKGGHQNLGNFPQFQTELDRILDPDN